MIQDFALKGTITANLSGVPWNPSLRGRLALCWRILRGKAVLPSLSITNCYIAGLEGIRVNHKESD